MFSMPDNAIGGFGIVFEYREFGTVPLANTGFLSSSYKALVATQQLLVSPDLPHWEN